MPGGISCGEVSTILTLAASRLSRAVDRVQEEKVSFGMYRFRYGTPRSLPLCSRETMGHSHHLALWLSAMRSSIIRLASRFVRGSTVPPRARIFAICGSVGSPSTSIPRFWRCGSCRSEYWPKRIWRLLLDIMKQMALAIRNDNTYRVCSRNTNAQDRDQFLGVGQLPPS